MTTVTWLLIFTVLVIIEAVTVNLVSIWFALGALVCSFVSVVAILCTKKIVSKVKIRELTPTNLDRIIGLTGIVTEKITVNSGEVSVDGKRWSAISPNEIYVGSKVEILAIDGVKLRVKLKEEEE